MFHFLDCPFCGSFSISMYKDLEKGWGYFVACDNCGASTGTQRTEEEAEKTWNTRKDNT